MTKAIAFISDIHGNYPALKAVLEDIRSKNIAEIYCLGDLVGYNSMVNEVVETIRDQSIPCLMGNHDYALVHHRGVIERSKTATRLLKRQLEELTPENLNFLNQLPHRLQIDGTVKMELVHGGIHDPIDEYLVNFGDAYLEGQPIEWQVLVTGHTHHFTDKKASDGRRHLNPGSVGQSRDGDPRASYGLYHSDGTFERIRVEYLVDEIVGDMRKKGYPDYVSEILYRGVGVGK